MLGPAGRFIRSARRAPVPSPCSVNRAAGVAPAHGGVVVPAAPIGSRRALTGSGPDVSLARPQLGIVTPLIIVVTSLILAHGVLAVAPVLASQ